MDQLITGGLEKTFAVTGENKKSKIVLMVIWMFISVVFLGVLYKYFQKPMMGILGNTAIVLLFVCSQIFIIIQASQI